jgi:hypothetical protein
VVVERTALLAISLRSGPKPGANVTTHRRARSNRSLNKLIQRSEEEDRFGPVIRALPTAPSVAPSIPGLDKLWIELGNKSEWISPEEGIEKTASGAICLA